ncbi:MAG: RNA methyltransferase [Bacteroidales bacterium]
MVALGNVDVINYLGGFVSEKRLEMLRYILSNRTRYITVVLEDIFQPQNASAVLRSCDCFGVQDVHIIENRNDFSVDQQVAMGSSKWLNLHRYSGLANNTVEAIGELKAQGYRIVATSPHTYVTSINNFDVTSGKFAMLFGTELTGLSPKALELADEYVLIPTYGFTESLNLSNSAAICLQQLSHGVRTAGIDFALTPNEFNIILHQWLRKSVRSWKLIEERFISQQNTVK